LATPNYGYEKRQKELAKKRKKEDKLKAKAERKLGDPGYDPAVDGVEDQPDSSDVNPPASEPPSAT
jgi:hypothetical protein